MPRPLPNLRAKRAKGPTDDRGQPIRPSAGQVLDGVYQRLPSSSLRARRIAMVVPLAFAISSFGCLIGLNLYRNLWGPSAGVFIGLGVITWCLRALLTRAPIQTYSATAVALGHCGACGYNLRDLMPDHDCCVQCPECGAAWHADRRTHAHWPQRWQARLLAMVNVPGRASRTESVGVVDDRGVQLFLGYSWPSRRRNPELLRRAAPAIRLYKLHRRRTRLWTLVVAPTLWMTSEALYAWLGHPKQSDLIILGLMNAVLIALFGGLFAMASLPRTTVRRLTLLTGMCPHCYWPLTPRSVCFDGCTICKRCRAAWIASDVRTGPGIH